MAKVENSLEKWLERDPYLQDMEAASKFLEDKVEAVPVKVTVTVAHRGYSTGVDGFEVWLEVPHEVVQPVDPEPDREYEKLEKRFLYYLERIGLKKGSTQVFRDNDGKWYYAGDFAHCPREDIMQNVRVLQKVMETIGQEVKGAFAASTDYDSSLYIATLKETKQRLPSISISHWDPAQFRKSHDYQQFHPLEENTEELTEEWAALKMLAGRLLLHDLLSGFDEEEEKWILEPGRDMTVQCAWRKTIPQVEEYLENGREFWDPFNDIDIGRNGGVEFLIHPFLRKVCYLTWDKHSVVWDPLAERAREIYYKKYGYEDLKVLTVDELKAICFAKGLNSQGRKQELVDRIHEACWPVKEKDAV